jgi:hypothetical protein
LDTPSERASAEEDAEMLRDILLRRAEEVS